MPYSRNTSHLHSPPLSFDERRILAEIIPDLVLAITHSNTSSEVTAQDHTTVEPPTMAGILTNIIQAIETSSETFAAARALGVSRLHKNMPRDQRNRARLCELMQGPNIQRLKTRTSKGIEQYLNDVRSQLQILDNASERMSGVLLDAWAQSVSHRKCPR